MVFFTRTRRDSPAKISEEEYARIILACADGLRDVNALVPPERVIRTFPNYKEQEYYLTTPQRIFLVLNTPTSSRLSTWYERVMSLMAIASIAAFVISTVPQYQ
jgi:hypothetical protein